MFVSGFARSLLNAAALKGLTQAYGHSKLYFNDLMKKNIKEGSNLYIHPEYTHLKDLSIYKAQEQTGALFHGARDPVPVLNCARENGFLPPGRALHVVNMDEVSTARAISGPNGVMALIENNQGVAVDSYGNTQISLHTPKKIIGIWSKDQGRVSKEYAFFQSLKFFSNQLLKKPNS
jgi:hypothetical protein